jgi:1-deoxy-D-xylulose-5-phosphate synthase
MAMLARVPGMRVLAPSSAQELQVMLHDAMHLADAGPVAIRYPRGQAPQVGELEVGVGIRARRMRAAEEPAGGVCLLAVGKMVGAAGRAADKLADRGVAVTLWDVRCCAPLDEDMLADAARHHRVVTVEDGVRDGGIGMHIAERLRARTTVEVAVLGLPSQFIPHHANPDQLLAKFGLDADGIVAAATS